MREKLCFMFAYYWIKYFKDNECNTYNIQGSIHCKTVGVIYCIPCTECVLQLETALATLVTTWFTLADRRWRSRYRSSDQCILNAFRSPERYNGWFREQFGQRFTFFNFFPMMTDNACNFLLRRMASENKGNPFVDLFFFVLQEVISVNFTGFWKPTLYNFVSISPFLQMMA